MVGCDHEWWHAKDLRCGQSVDVVATAVGLDQKRVFGEVGEQAQFNLRVVGCQQHVPGFGDEGSTNLAAEFCTNGNVLQIWIGRREPSGSGSSLPESGMQSPRGRAEQRGLSVDVRRFELGQLPVFEHQLGDLVILGQRL